MELKKVHAVEQHIIRDGKTIARAIQVGNGPKWIILNLSGTYITEVARKEKILDAYQRLVS